MHNEIHIFKKITHPLNINNSGTLNNTNLQFAKRTLLFDALREHSNELVKHLQHYPEGDISDVDLSLDIVIMSTKQYQELVKDSTELKISQ